MPVILRRRSDTPCADNRKADEVVQFWRDSGPDQWFQQDPHFDRYFRARFLDLHLAAARHEHDNWLTEPGNALALMILLDQFPRNAFRHTPHMYATDPLARHFALLAVKAGHLFAVEPPLRLFFCLPFAHSENLADQDLSVELNSQLGPVERQHAEGHRDIIRRFGRFPHRNRLLLRGTTPQEQAFLDNGGFAG
ncbi:DUF924 family protein [Serratia entomophila]|uniref:DUF924 family protein n=1 Tax=Serratia entomophila TaxID=42906 RepID=UPI002178FC3B|nr:DUF924 family protein [Serratia entomophila]CAI1074459.1 Uncharacterized protein conserved in bacteria [Serratia entomophila]CAI1118887.1 Uncharacterized protein conserved in bacteria [Serratia entomophila]CAI1120321.1 Uncharacterized protein conserved in bacteria [Serratia entomophila]CAI1123774.1 Uncharacterized protein conserved in bacteria [Serratia entomophila]CAI1913228.1 Uncharacterized protein conserved in bacteria [Serratia entomophila]